MALLKTEEAYNAAMQRIEELLKIVTDEPCGVYPDGTRDCGSQPAMRAPMGESFPSPLRHNIKTPIFAGE